jgi:hypothetical protein
VPAAVPGDETMSVLTQVRRSLPTQC